MTIKMINNRPYVKVEKARGVWAFIQYWFWRSVGGKSNPNVETAMVDVFRKRIVTRSSDDGYIPYSLYIHETIHIAQIEHEGRVLFCIKFIGSLLYNIIKFRSFMEGYRNVSFEIEAIRLTKVKLELMGYE